MLFNKIEIQNSLSNLKELFFFGILLSSKMADNIGHFGRLSVSADITFYRIGRSLALNERAFLNKL